MPDEAPEITRVLRDLRGGDARAVDVLLPLVYEELRHIASRAMRRERAGHTLEPTGLVITFAKDGNEFNLLQGQQNTKFKKEAKP